MLDKEHNDCIDELTDCTVQLTDCTVQSTEYSIEDLEKILRVKRRQILNYAATVCENRWEPEILFKPSFGKFSERMLEEMRKLQYIGVTEYKEQCALESEKPLKGIESSALTILPETAISRLDNKIANLQRVSIQVSTNLADRLKSKLAQIQKEGSENNQRLNSLKEAQLLAAENEGFEEALEIHARRIAAKNATLAQLKAMELESEINKNQ